MSNFEVKIVKVDDVVDHPDADRLSLVKIAGYSVVAAKSEDNGQHRYKKGDLVAYVPENAILPEYLLKKGFWDPNKNKGMLAGPLGNRVKPIKLRGVLSEGILFPTFWGDRPGGDVIYGEEIDGEMTVKYIVEGDDVSEFLGIVKWEPEVPSNMSGDLIGCTETVKYDIENIKKFDNVLYEGESVYFTEKLHGTQTQFGWLLNEDDEKFFDGQFFVSSKGIAAKNLIFKNTEENRNNNLYVKALLDNIDKFKALRDFFTDAKKVVFFGEIFGKGVQDLNYNVQKPSFRIFDIMVDGLFLDFERLISICSEGKLEIVPILYVGPYSKDILKAETSGTTKVNGAHLREGLVVKPTRERRHPILGRVILKSVSEDYINRKGKITEYV